MISQTRLSPSVEAIKKWPLIWCDSHKLFNWGEIYDLIIAFKNVPVELLDTWSLITAIQEGLLGSTSRVTNVTISNHRSYIQYY